MDFESCKCGMLILNLFYFLGQFRGIDDVKRFAENFSLYAVWSSS